MHGVFSFGGQLVFFLQVHRFYKSLSRSQNSTYLLFVLMVEGPGVRLNAEKLTRTVINKIICAVSGKALDCSVSAGLVGQCLRSILPLGKELFLFFLAARNVGGTEDQTETCLRLHFGMSGSALVDHVHRFRKTPVMEIHFDSGNILRLYETTLEIRDASSTRAKIERLHSLDVCSQASRRPRRRGVACAAKPSPRSAAAT